MNVEIRIYKRYDTDLLSLHDAGYSVTKMMAEAVSAYANGLPYHLYIDELVPFDMNDKKSVRLRLKFKDSDKNVAALIRNVKHGYRSNFCKQVLRNALICQNLFCYYTDASMLPVQEANMLSLNIHAFPGLRNCSDYRRMTQQINIMGRDVTIQHEQGYKVPVSVPQKKSTPNYSYSKGYTQYPNQQAQMMQPAMIPIPNQPMQTPAQAQQNNGKAMENNQFTQPGPVFYQSTPVTPPTNMVSAGIQVTSPEPMHAPLPVEPQIVQSPASSPPIQPALALTPSVEYEEPLAGNTKESTPETQQSSNNAALMRLFEGI